MKDNEEETFEELQVDFHHYMVEFGGIMPRTSKNYLAWLKFLSANYRLDGNISDEYIDHILSQELIEMSDRDIYTTKKDLTNFKSALRAFKSFIGSDYHKRYEESVLHEIDKVKADTQIKETEKDAIIKSRVGQGQFRNRLIKYWNGCAVCGFDVKKVLVASHIKPWRDADNRERLDVYNGLLLIPNYDKLFDYGYITFDTKGKMICSKLLPDSERKLVGLYERMKLTKIEEPHKPYLKYHNENVFMG